MGAMEGKRYRVVAPGSPTYHRRGRQGSLTPDLVGANTTGIKVEVVRGDQWEGTSGHHQVVCMMRNVGEGLGRGEKSVSKMALHNVGRAKVVAKAYRRMAPELVSRLQEEPETTAQKMYGEVT